MKCTRSLFFLSCFAFLLGTFATSPRARAATITVTSSGDSGPGTLRTAVAATADGDVINFSLPAGSRITLTSGELLVSKSISVVGPGWTNLTIDGNHASRAFHVTPSNSVTISGLTISSCVATGRPPGNLGGAIFSDQATLTIRDCTLSNNFARAGGAVANYAAGGIATLTI